MSICRPLSKNPHQTNAKYKNQTTHMLTLNDLVKLPVTPADIRRALQQTLQQKFIDNLRHRSLAVQLDCKIRGYLGEIALRNWFAAQDIHFAHSNTLPDGVNIDIDLAYRGKTRLHNLEIKTSLVPDNYRDLAGCLKKCDIKLIRRGTATVEQLSGDMHLQIFYDFQRKKCDNWLKTVECDWQNAEEIYEKLWLKRYLNRTYFAGWIDKPTLQRQINALPENRRMWSFPQSQRSFWYCNLERSARKPREIAAYLQKL